MRSAGVGTWLEPARSGTTAPQNSARERALEGVNAHGARIAPPVPQAETTWVSAVCSHANSSTDCAPMQRPASRVSASKRDGGGAGSPRMRSGGAECGGTSRRAVILDRLLSRHRSTLCR